MLAKKSHLTIKECSKYILLNETEVQTLKEFLNEYPNKLNGSSIRIGLFGCAIGSGVLVEVDGECFDITDYDSW